MRCDYAHKMMMDLRDIRVRATRELLNLRRIEILYPLTRSEERRVATLEKVINIVLRDEAAMRELVKDIDEKYQPYMSLHAMNTLCKPLETIYRKYTI